MKECLPLHIRKCLQLSSYDQAYMVYKTHLLWKLLSIFVSEIINTSTLPLICFESNSNLFRIEFKFKWAKISTLRLSPSQRF